jgi:RimJ/RimL family protein N-acetyltransferase
MVDARRIVPAGTEDAEAIAAMALDIWRRCWCPGVLTADEIEYFWQRAYGPEILREHMQSGAVYEWIEAEGRKIGFLAYRFETERNRLHLGKLYLLPEYHGQGIGAEALARVQALAAELGVQDIWLYVFRKNERAVRAYFRAGFVVERAEVTDCGDGFCYDDLVMVWRAEPG